MQSETGFPRSHQLKSYVASKSRLKLAARAVLSADAGLLVRVTQRARSTQSSVAGVPAVIWVEGIEIAVTHYFRHTLYEDSL